MSLEQAEAPQTEDIQEEQLSEEKQAEEENPFKSQLSQVQKDLEEQRERYKDLSRRLTQAQQENAELYRYHKATLPKINKSFEERWDESPQSAVGYAVEEKVAPVNTRIAQVEARQWETQYLVENPNMAKFRSRVLELGDEHPHLTSYQNGIAKLYEMAEAEVIREEYKKLKANGQAEVEKQRAYTESSSTKAPTQKQQRRLDQIQRRVAQELGIKEEDYAKRLEEIEIR